MGAARSILFKTCPDDDVGTEVGLAVLPTELLLCIMEYLTEEELLGVRGVCRRWRDLALSESLWRRRELVVGMGRHFSPGWRLILARAPCVGKVWLSGRWATRRIDPASVRCAIVKLDLRDVEEIGQTDLSNVARIISQQAPLGGLRGLRLHLSPLDSSEDFTELFEAIGQCAIERLTVRLWDRGLPRCSREAWIPRRPNTLKKLSYIACAVWPDPWLQSLLQQHADSLENVRLFNPSLQFPCSLVAACANLRLLNCPLLPDMDSLLQCRQLEELRLEIGRNSADYFKGSGGSRLQGAVSFLGAATWLRTLALYVLTDTEPGAARSAVRAAKDVVAAVASSGRAALSRLSIATPEDLQGAAWLGAVLDLLSGLPRLEALGLLTSAMPPASVLRAITPAAAPALRALRLPWLLVAHKEHMDEVRALLTRCPGIHVTGLMLAGRQRGGDWEGLARELGLPIDCRFNLYSHPEQQLCNLHAVTQDSDPWFYVKTHHM